MEGGGSVNEQKICQSDGIPKSKKTKECRNDSTEKSQVFYKNRKQLDKKDAVKHGLK